MEVLPESIRVLKEEIDSITAELGLENFRDLLGASGNFSLG
jgi:hypothetical protein